MEIVEVEIVKIAMS